MTVFRLLLIVFLVVLVAYTLQVMADFGWNFLTPYFEDVTRLDWSGQFVTDFTILLSLAALWIAWRNGFSAGGIALGVLALPLGSLMVAGYLLYLTFKENGDMTRVMVGDRLGGVR